MYTIQAIWNRIEVWLNIYAPHVLDNLLPGVDNDAIQEMEAELGYQLPEDVRASLRFHNGTDHGLDGLWRLLPLDGIVREHQQQLEVLHQLPEGIWWWYPHWIPLVSDGAGDFLCVDCAAESHERLGQIIEFDHETASRWIAPSFHALLSAFADHLEAGKYTLDAYGYLHSEEPLFSRPQFPPGRRQRTLD